MRTAGSQAQATPKSVSQRLCAPSVAEACRSCACATRAAAASRSARSPSARRAASASSAACFSASLRAFSAASCDQKRPL